MKWFCEWLAAWPAGVLAAGLLLLCSASLQADEPSEPLIVSQDHAWPPFAFAGNGGEPRGLLVDLWQELAEELDRPVEFRLVDWPRTLELVRDGEADIHGGLIQSPEREQTLIFSDVLLPLRTFAFVRTGAPVARLDELADEPTGVVDGSFELEFMQREHPEQPLQIFDNNEQMVRAAVDGTIEVFVGDYPVAMYLLDRHGEAGMFHPLELLYEQPLRAAVAPGDEALLDEINEAIARLDDELLRQITQRWIHSDTIEVIPAWLTPTVIGAALLATLLYMALLLRQRRTLETRVRQRTTELEDERELFRTLTEHAAAGVFILQNDRFQTVNPALSRILGRPESWLLTQPFYEVIHPEQRDAITRRARDRIAGKEVPDHYEMKVITGEGETRWVDLTAGRVELQNGPASIGTMYDITDRRLLEDQLRASEAQYRQLVENIGDIIYTLTPDGILSYVSPQWTRVLGYAARDVTGTPIIDYVHRDDRGECGRFLQRTIRSENDGQEIEYRIRHHNGEWRWHVSSGAPIRDSNGRITGYVGVARDITDRRRMHDELQYQARFNAMLARLSSDFVTASTDLMDQRLDAALADIGRFFESDRCYLFELSPDGEHMDNTHEWCAPGVFSVMNQLRHVDLVKLPWWRTRMLEVFEHRTPVMIASVDDLPEEAAIERELFRRQGIRTLICVPILTGQQVTGFLGMDMLRPRTWREDQTELLLVLGNVISEALQRNHLEVQLRDLGITDPLTGLYNRRYLMERLREQIEAWRRHGDNFALVILDLDHFKALNDTHGHLAGDEVLRNFSDVLRREHRAFDIVARFGGEEFIVVLTHVDHEAATIAIERLLQATRELDIHFEGESLPFTVSAGLAWSEECDPAHLTPEVLIDLADERLYRAKEQGRDRLVAGDA
ncbi:diguanylate cyclase [Thioalkalivibrio sp. ARh3]|uniref:diguanylate cyclase n=1 Tax=Thioalkalivibrio sp. ARh3 TaxID=1158148 RepID=UPI000687BE04